MPLIQRQRLSLAARIYAATRALPTRSYRISAVAALALLALMFDWSAQALEWWGSRIVPVLHNGTPFYRVLASDSRLATALSYAGLALFVWSGILGLMQARQSRLPRPVAFLLGTMLLYAAFWVIVGYEPLEYRYAFGTTGPLAFTMCLGVYAGFDRTLWRVLRPLALMIAYSAAVLALYYAIQLSTNGTFEGTTPMNKHLQTAFWCALGAVVLNHSTRWKSQIAALLPIAICIPVSILIACRSWAVLSILALACGLKLAFPANSRAKGAKSIAFGMVCLGILGVGIWTLATILPERVEAFEKRLLEDTRTGQYVQFFQQVRPLDLITGRGPKATYVLGDQRDFSSIDNQFLYILFKCGLPVLLGYCAVVLWPGLRLAIGARTPRERLPSVFFMFWILACLGVSIFHGIVNNPQNLLAILLAGRCFALLASRSKPALSSQRQTRRLCSGRFQSPARWCAPGQTHPVH